MKKIFSILLCVCFCPILLIGCSEPQKNAADSVKAIYDLYILGDTAGITSLGMTEEDITAARQTYDNSLKETIRSNFANSGQEIEEHVLDELCEARKAALSKMKSSAEIVSESEGRATVVIHTTYFKEAELDADAFYAAKEAAQQNQFSSVEEQQVFLMNTYTQNLIEAYQNVTPSEENTDISVECVVQNNTWVPANMSSFGSDLALAVTGQN
ncbi:MAG: DUF5105 domain-containing protein [Lachnospiraceae bacterium]|nr:DUF5105 domain-containing protein [Lachnospiraceae bacterium]